MDSVHAWSAWWLVHAWIACGSSQGPHAQGKRERARAIPSVRVPFPLLVAEPPLRGGLPQLKPSSGEDRVTRGSVSFLVVQGTFELFRIVAWQANPQKLQVQSSISQVTRKTGRSTLVGKPGARTSY